MAKLIPYISCRNASDVLDFYTRAFGATVQSVTKQPDGRIMHAVVDIQGATVYVMDEMPEHGGKSPMMLDGVPLLLALEVDDCDALFSQAVAAGAEVEMPLADMFWGQRWGVVKDPTGFKWSIATWTRQVDPKEIEAAMAGGAA